MTELKYQDFYNEDYYLNMVPGMPYDRSANNGYWLRFFNTVADKLTNYLQPKAILDVGCAKGFLLEAFYNRGVSVSGFDCSKFAVSCIREDLKPFAFVSSATNLEVFQKCHDRYDLITCIEVVEHMPQDEALCAIKNMCLSANSIFFSSTSDDFSEPTHLTVLPRINWLKIFLEYNFIPDYDFSMPEIPHSILLRKIDNERKEISKLIELHELNLDVRKNRTSDLESQKLQTQSELERSQSELQQAESELERSQSELQQAKSELERSQSGFQQAKSELERSQSGFQQAKSELERSQSGFQQAKSELERSRAELTRSQNIIAAMETSKFWQLRIAWFWFKHAIGIQTDSEFYSYNSSPINRSITILKSKGFGYVLSKIFKKVTPKLNALQIENDGNPALLKISSLDRTYNKWLDKNFPKEADLLKMAESLKTFSYQPVISVIMPVFNPAEQFLRQAIESVINQIYPYWELCIADDASTHSFVNLVLEEYAAKDPRIKVTVRKENGHISRASNSAIDLAVGEFITLLDHDDLLTPDALYEVALLLNKHPQADMIYSDEDKLEEDGSLKEPFFKPDWCPDSFLSRMYTCHLGTYRRSLVNQIGGFRVGYEGSQDYDLVLRFTEQTENIFHISKVLYHWRVHLNSTAKSLTIKNYATDASYQAIFDALQRRNEPGQVIPVCNGYHLVRYDIKDFKLVTIVIPTRNLGKILDKCLTSIFEKTQYPNYEILVIDNGSNESDTLETLDRWQLREPQRFRFKVLNIDFNYSKINNYAASLSKSEYLLFLNNDTEVLTCDWVDAMVEQAQRPSIGVVGALLLYPDNTIQHAGIVPVGGIAGHSHKYYSSDAPGYFNQIQTINNYSALTGACLMCRRKVFEAVGGFEEELAVAFNDVDLCFKIFKAGYNNVYLPHVVLYHYESKTRGAENTPERQSRFNQEIEYMQNKWKEIIEHDPCYSSNLTRQSGDFSIQV
jgi:O-antigen biosynthesis protein